MPRRSRAAFFRTARFFLVLGVLLWPWPSLGRAYVGAFDRAGGPWIRSTMAGSGFDVSLGLFPENDTHHEWSSMVFVTDAESHVPRHRGAADLRRSGYMQMAIFLAAAAAFPLRGGLRFAISVALGLVLFAMLGWLPVAMYLAKKQVLHLGVGSYAALAVAERSLVGAPGMAFALPALIWVLAMALDRSIPSAMVSIE